MGVTLVDLQPTRPKNKRPRATAHHARMTLMTSSPWKKGATSQCRTERWRAPPGRPLVAGDRRGGLVGHAPEVAVRQLARVVLVELVPIAAGAADHDLERRLGAGFHVGDERVQLRE